jgi:hypothetical protein
MIKFNYHSLYAVVILVLMSLSCEDNSETTPEAPLEVQMAMDVPADPDAPRGAPPSFTFYDLETGQILQKSDSNSNQWDIALAATTILINGGTSGPGQGSAQIVTGVFDDLSEAPATGYAVDSEASLAIPTGSGNGWYNYTGNDGTPVIAILPIPGRIITLTTGEGNYAKIEILSYYEGNPDTTTPEFADPTSRPASRYYTFRYVVQPDGSTTF